MDSSVHFLIVEDDDDINRLLSKIMKKSGYCPQSAFSGTEGLTYLNHHDWDLILLDLMLPGMAGEALLEKIRAKGQSPVIIISAKGEQQAKIDCLRSGADDYINKKKELIHQDIAVDLDAKEVKVKGNTVKLTFREYSILVLLILSPRKIFTKANLFESVWEEPYRGDENTVNVHMSNLRAKQAKANPQSDYIETVWGMGYRMKT